MQIIITPEAEKQLKKLPKLEQKKLRKNCLY